MLKSIIITLTLLMSGGLLPGETATAQNPPAKTHQPGFWQPLARADINRPITINLINQAELIVDYAITEIKMKPVSIESGQTIILDNVKPPLDIVIYPDSKNPRSSRIYLQYEVKVTQENIVEVKIKTTEDGAQSHRSFNLQETGAIYLY